MTTARTDFAFGECRRSCYFAAGLTRRQSAIAFLLIGLIFLLNGFSVIFETKWIFYAVIAVVVIAMVYAIVSSVMIEKNKKR